MARFNDMFGPVAEFEALRALGQKQEDAEASVTERFHISKRTLWDRRGQLKVLWPEAVSAFRSALTVRLREASAPESLSVPERIGIAVGRVWARIAAELDDNERIVLGEMLLSPAVESWAMRLNDEAEIRAYAAVQDLYESLARDPPARPLSQVEFTDLALAVYELEYESHATTAIKSHIAKQKS